MRIGRLTALALALGLGLSAGCAGPERATSEAIAPNAEIASKPDDSAGRADREGGGSGKRVDPGSGSRSEGQGTNRARTPVQDRAIVRTGSIVVQAKDPQAVAERVVALVKGTEGFVGSLQSASGDKPDGTIDSVDVVLRVPVDQFDHIRTSIRGFGKVLADKQSTTDVTDEMVDTESRIKSQQRSIDRMRTLLGQAKTVGEVIQVESELASRQAELESLQARQAALASQSTLSTLTVRVEKPPAKAGPAKPKEDTDLGFLAGLRGGWDALVGGAQVLLTVVGAVLPFGVVVLVIGGPVLWIYLRARRRNRPMPEAPASA